MILPREIILSCLPPIVLPILRRFLKVGIWYEKGFDTWDSAVAASLGYDSNEIVSKVLKTSLLARDEGLHERDGFILDAPDFNPYTWIGIIQGHRMINGSRKIRIVDFGGSFGSTYRTFQDQLRKSKIDFEWVVIDKSTL
jgi:putative methyltransferase (TIGR04325 family)